MARRHNMMKWHARTTILFHLTFKKATQGKAPSNVCFLVFFVFRNVKGVGRVWLLATMQRLRLCDPCDLAPLPLRAFCDVMTHFRCGFLRRRPPFRLKSLGSVNCEEPYCSNTRHKAGNCSIQLSGRCLRLIASDRPHTHYDTLTTISSLHIANHVLITNALALHPMRMR